MKKIVLVPIAIVLIVAITVPILVTQLADKEDPVITSYYPDEFLLSSGVVALGMEAEDNSGTVLYSIFLDDELVSTSNTYDWDTATCDDGSIVEIVFKAEDKRGNSVEESVKLAVDNFIDSPRDDVFKVMAYNIWESGEKVIGFNGETRPKGAWKDVMREENADIAILVETGSLDDAKNYQLNDAIERLNAYHYDEAPYEGYTDQAISAHTDGEAILSRYPILEFNQITEYRLDNGETFYFHHDFFDAVVDIQGIHTHFIAYHGKCCNNTGDEPPLRRNETETILNYLDDLGDVPIIWGGDFNAFSPVDVADPALAPMGDLGDGPLTMILDPDDPTWGSYSSQVHNFTDVYRTLNPTSFGPTFGRWEPQYWGRIDYIIVNHHWADKMINSTAGDTPSANSSSDHYSVDCFFSLDENYTYFEPVFRTPKEASTLIISDSNPLILAKQRFLIALIKTKH
ncbi:MAG: endonuclease/exonuclease/phosphatase family protein [Candidatus Heimdallarchaeota archaeon]|nr:endonuclease/exonuclease/phosphatase family protein [Candidatus Heimdallarchaeota archaeon]